MSIDWAKLAVEVGSVPENFQPDGSSRMLGGTQIALRALERIIGEENISNAVNAVLEFRPEGQLAMDVLRQIQSRQALDLAYAAYKASEGERAGMAVGLIAEIGHPHAIEWIREFLTDENVVIWGVKALDQLLYTEQVEPGDVEDLLVLAEHHKVENVREQAAFIREYLKNRTTG